MTTNEYGDCRDKASENRKHKDRLFRLVVQEKRYQLELYNALNGTDYTDSEVLEETTLEDAIFLGVKNDLSFIIGMSLNMCEAMAIISMRNHRFHCLFRTISFSTMG